MTCHPRSSILAALLVVLSGGAAFGQKAAAPAAAARAPFKLYDWMGFSNQPDLRGRGWEPVFGAMDGTYNRSTVPEGDNVPGTGDPAGGLFAAQRQVRAALGIEPLAQDMWNRPREYEKVKRDIVFDLEGPAFKKAADSEASTRSRRKVIDSLCRHFDEMKLHAKMYNQEVRIGSYMPIGPFGENLNPNDKRYRGLVAAAEQDWRPWTGRLDFVMPEMSMMHADVGQCVADARKTIDEHKRLAPGKPLYAEMQLCYAHYAPEDIRYQLVPLDDFSKYVSWLAKQPDVAGICLFGQYAKVPDGVTVGDESNGTLQLDWQHVDPHVRQAELLTRLRRATAVKQ